MSWFFCLSKGNGDEEFLNQNLEGFGEWAIKELYYCFLIISREITIFPNGSDMGWYFHYELPAPPPFKFWGKNFSQLIKIIVEIISFNIFNSVEVIQFVTVLIP